jgi:hypothetical protein
MFQKRNRCDSEIVSSTAYESYWDVLKITAIGTVVLTFDVCRLQEIGVDEESSLPAIKRKR